MDRERQAIEQNESFIEIDLITEVSMTKYQFGVQVYGFMTLIMYTMSATTEHKVTSIIGNILTFILALMFFYMCWKGWPDKLDNDEKSKKRKLKE